ncbi:unnamed protein product [Onchocerca flexuosa]|uniref:Oxidoreductase n=1 Tax=Onchocerca flexuosa TaxID=387005 RepID=A0A183HTR5_9BILA|nr:unnamed protein product [Onchocerca flexuosa]
MLPPDTSLNTAEGIDGNGWNRNMLFGLRPTCGWLEKFFDLLFPPDEKLETVAFCGASQ